MVHLTLALQVHTNFEVMSVQSKYMLTSLKKNYLSTLQEECTYRIDRMAAKYLLCSSAHKNV